MSETLAGKHVLSGDEPEEPAAGAPASHAGTADAADGQATQPLEPPLEPPLAVATPGASARERVTCPECGTVASVALTRRESSDFCAQCDYPLFWTPSKVVLDDDAASAESLRRLPGAAGRVTVASIPCPHCSEGNLLTAQVCLRCGGLMNPPEPEPVVVAPPPPPPPPPPAPEPEPGTPLWVWIVGGTTLLLLVALVVYVLTTR